MARSALALALIACGSPTSSLGEPSADAGVDASSCGSWRRGPALLDQREGSPAFLLDDGRVLLVAGHFDNRTGKPLNSSELVDIDADTSTLTGTFTVPRTITGQGGTVLLLDGRVLSGSPFVWTDEAPIPAEVWDPATGEWSVTGTQRVPGGPAVTLPDGRVLVAGGIDWNVDAPLARAELWDPATGEWTEVDAMSTARTGHALIVAGGRALAIGGFDVYPDGAALGSCEAFDPIEHAWSACAALNEDAAATVPCYCRTVKC